MKKLHIEASSSAEDLSDKYHSLQEEYDNYKKKSKKATSLLQEKAQKYDKGSKELENAVVELKKSIEEKEQEMKMKMNEMEGLNKVIEQMKKEKIEEKKRFEEKEREYEKRGREEMEEKSHLERELNALKEEMAEKSDELEKSEEEKRLINDVLQDLQKEMSEKDKKYEALLIERAAIKKKEEVIVQSLPAPEPSIEATKNVENENDAFLTNVASGVNEETIGIFKLPHKMINELREETEGLVRKQRQLESKVEGLEKEISLKNKYIQDLEGDIKQVKSIAAEENIVYMRHTLVKFLCNSTRSEQQKIVHVVEQLLEMTPEESQQLEKNYYLNQKGWFF